MDDALSIALAFDRRLRERTAAQVRRQEGVTVLRDDALARVHYLNAVLVHPGAPVADGAAAVALAEHALPGGRDRHVAFDDAALGERVAAELAAAGWERERTLYMAREPGTPGPGPDPRAREISEAQARALEAVSLAEAVGPTAIATGLLDALVHTARRRRGANRARCFGAGEGPDLQSMGTLFCDGDGERPVAMIEGVGTRVAQRERGLARAVVSAAITAARDWGAELVLVAADADDWPQLMYSRLGFAPLGVQVAVTRAVSRTDRRAPGSGPGAV